MATVTWLTTWGNHHTDRPSGQPDILFFYILCLLKRVPPLNKRRPPAYACIFPTTMWLLLIFDMVNAEMLKWLILLLLERGVGLEN